jgi:hypothetical protein
MRAHLNLLKGKNCINGWVSETPAARCRHATKALLWLPATQAAYNSAMIDLAERLGPASRTLEIWANLYRQGAFRTPMPPSSWQAADDLIRAAKQADGSASDDLAKALDRSNRALYPLADPLATEFSTHRWLSADREEVYSDWLGWIMEQIGDARRILRLLGVRDRKLNPAMRVGGTTRQKGVQYPRWPDGSYRRVREASAGHRRDQEKVVRPGCRSRPTD